MLLRLLLLFTLVPIVELALLIEVGRQVGTLPTVIVVIGTGIAGAALARSQGSQAFSRLKSAIGSGVFPAEEIFDGALILGGGLLLVTPGLLTDLIGFAALIPGSRRLVKEFLKRLVRQKLRSGVVRVKYDVN